MRGLSAIVVAIGLLLAVALSASGAEPGPRPTARALIAGGDAGARAQALARGTQDRSRTGRVQTVGVSVDNGESIAHASVAEGTARAAAVARTVSLLDGRVTAYGIRRVADATVKGAEYQGRIEGLVVDGRRIGTVTRGQTIPLADGAGTVTVNTGSIGLEVELAQGIAGLPAGTDLRLAVAEADVRAPRARATPEPTPTPAPTAARKRAGKRTGQSGDKARKAALKRRKAPSVDARLTRGGFAFPVYGKASVADNFGAARAAPIVSHEGDDVFAEFGAPVVAVTDGVVSRVGTLPISGNRLWLTSAGGDAFFYAHLSAFAPAAVDGRHVKAGTVLGFVGNTGDAEPTPPHVHFEVHPGGEEQDAVDPYRILTAWQGRRDVPAGAWLQEYGPDTTARPGSLVAVRDFIAE